MSDLAALPYTGGHDRQSQGRDAHALQPDRRADHAAQAAFPNCSPGKEVILAFLPFFHIYGQVVIMLNAPVPGEPAGALHQPRHRGDPGRDGALSGDRVLRRADALRVPEGPQGHRQGELAAPEARALGRRHAARVDHAAAGRSAPARKITEGYGLSETARAEPPQSDRTGAKPGSFGCPVPEHAGGGHGSRDARVRRRRARPGELVLAGPERDAGLLEAPEENARAFVERSGVRWMRTGDIVRMDDEGYFHFYDRSKDLIKFKGHSIFAKDVEDVLYGHPQIKAAGVIGVARPGGRPAHQGDRGAAGRRARQGERGRDQGLSAASSLAEYKVPHIVEFRGELPKTDVGKVSRRELRDETRRPS